MDKRIAAALKKTVGSRGFGRTQRQKPEEAGVSKIKTTTNNKLLYDRVSVYASTNFQRLVGSLTKLYRMQRLFKSEAKYSKLGRIRKKSVEAYFNSSPGN
jgi:predicted transcriptional regulator